MADFDPVTYRKSQGSLSEQGAVNSFDPVAYRAAGTNSPDNPTGTSLFANDEDRLKMGFASPDVAKSYYEGNGFSNPQRNKSGDTVVQDKSGKWYKDQSNFWPTTTGTPGAGVGARLQESLMSAHPANWLETHIGGALPIAGQTVGEGLAALAAPETGGASLAGAMGAGGVGAAAGEAARQGIGHAMGVNTAPLDAKEIAEQGAIGTLAAPIARGAGALSKVGVNALGREVTGLPTDALAQLGRGARNVLAKVTGVEPESMGQFLKSPTDVAKAEPLPIAQQAESDIQAGRQTLGKNVENSWDSLLSKQGQKPVDARATIARARQQITEGLADGSIHPDEVPILQKHIQDYLTTAQDIPGVPAPPTIQQPWERGEIDNETKLYRGRHPVNGKGDWTLNPGEAVSHAGGGPVDVSTVGNIHGANLVPNAESFFPEGMDTPLSGTMKGAPRVQVPSSEIPTTQEVPNPAQWMPGGEPRTVQQPVTTLDRLRQAIGQLSPGTKSMPKTAFGQQPLNGTSDKLLNQLEMLSGKLRKLAVSGGGPEADALARTNAEYAANETGMATIKGVANDPVQENFIRGLSNQGKTAQMSELEKRVSPDTLEAIRNMIAQNQMAKTGGVQGALRSTMRGAGAVNRAMSLPGTSVTGPWSTKQGDQP